MRELQLRWKCLIEIIFGHSQFLCLLLERSRYGEGGNSGNSKKGLRGLAEQSESFRPVRNTGDRVSYEEMFWGGYESHPLHQDFLNHLKPYHNAPSSRNVAFHGICRLTSRKLRRRSE